MKPLQKEELETLIFTLIENIEKHQDCEPEKRPYLEAMQRCYRELQTEYESRFKRKYYGELINEMSEVRRMDVATLP